MTPPIWPPIWCGPTNSKGEPLYDVPNGMVEGAIDVLDNPTQYDQESRTWAVDLLEYSIHWRTP